MINNTAASWDDKISKIVAVSGATKEEASRALDENGGDIDGAVWQLTNTKKQAEKQDMDNVKGPSESVAKGMKTSFLYHQPDDANDAGAKPFAAVRQTHEQLEYTHRPLTEYVDTRGNSDHAIGIGARHPRQPEPLYPGAVAVDGLDDSEGNDGTVIIGEEERSTMTVPPSVGSPFTNTMSPVTARIVQDSEDLLHKRMLLLRK